MFNYRKPYEYFKPIDLRISDLNCIIKKCNEFIFYYNEIIEYGPHGQFRNNFQQYWIEKTKWLDILEQALKEHQKLIEIVERTNNDIFNHMRTRPTNFCFFN